MDGDELPTGEIADLPRQRERVAASLEPVDSDDDGAEHGCDLGLGVHDPRLGTSRSNAIRGDRALALWKSRTILRLAPGA
jgi:hypothetical protein